MIIQSDNHPTIFTFDEDISAFPKVEIGLYDKATGGMLKRWHKADITFDQIGQNYTASVSWTQEQTAALPAETVEWDVKALDSDGLVQFWVITADKVEARRNREVMA